MHWIVLWAVISQVQTECPDFKPDPYTGQLPLTHCLVYHSKRVIHAEAKEFETKAEAETFIKDAPETVRKRMVLQNMDGD